MTPPEVGESRPPLAPGRRLLRAALSLALLAAATATVVSESSIRDFESWVLADLISGVFRVPMMHDTVRPIVYFTMPGTAPHGGGGNWVALIVTKECTVAWLLAPLLVVASAALFGRRLTTRAVVVVTAVTALLLFGVNMLRLSVIAMSTHWWGLEGGYRWSHEIYGSLITVAGICIGIGVFARWVVRLSRPQQVS